MRRIVCRRFGVSICLRAGAPGCKNDRGIAESVKRRQRAGRRAWVASVLCPGLAPEFAPLVDASPD
ncbi:hypothetical protein D3X12_02070 [Pseudomonas protegens]|uniref:Uncharacterized protein n=1 Tax=Pseudomonas protegens TaxID=380021 RepID=A0ABY2VAK4_9PSED|nr:hypothetical protein CEP86_10565 [Pseudomonas protegens]QEN50621.1 hypothetical protein CLA18_30185 [Pseudomonas protegens]QEZ49520.1 hypothetical protein D3X12_02070 [Pseudomonas protegens]QEZ58388.1 hypothetical protein D4N38_17410 [Pseudomonas protegens]QEZ66694.1 hypothetical protein D4N37_29730 [Pseudomonas protegens]